MAQVTGMSPRRFGFVPRVRYKSEDVDTTPSDSELTSVTPAPSSTKGPYHDIDLPRGTRAPVVKATMTKAKASEVTLVVYRWQNAQPGTLSWVFPSLEAALRAARALKNAVGWAILKGREALEVDAARGLGLVMAEAI